MALTKKVKIWLIVLSVPVVLVVAAAIGLKLYFTSVRLKTMAIPALEDATQRTVSIHDIHLSFFPTFGLEIDSLRIDNRKGPGFSSRPLLLLDRLVLDVRIMALFKNALEVNTVVLEHPQIFVEMNREGHANYATDGKPDEEELKGKAEVTTASAFLLSNCQIVNGNITYINRKKHSRTIIDGFNTKIRMEFVPVSDRMNVESQSTIDNFSWGSDTTNLLSDVHVSLELNMMYELTKDILTLQNGQGSLVELPFTVNGSISDLTKRFMMDVVVESKDVNIADLFSLIPGEYMKKASDLKGTGVAQVKLNIGGTVDDSTEADFSGVISSTGASVQYVSLPKPITDISIVADFTRTKARQEFNITKLSALMGNSSVRARLSMKGFDHPVINLGATVALNLAEVKDYYPLEKGTDLAGRLQADVNIAGKVSDPQAMKASGTMEFQKVTIASAGSKNPVQNLNGMITINNQIVETKKLSMTLGKSDLSLAFWLKNYLSVNSTDGKAPKPSANLTLTSDHIYTADIMPEETAQAAVGESDGEAHGQSKPKSGLPLPNVDMDVSASIGTLTMEKFELRNVRSTLNIVNGILDIRNLSCNTLGGSVITKGTLDFRKHEQPMFDLDLDMNGLDGNVLLSKFTPFGQRVFGKITMNTTMKGSLDDTLGLVSRTLSGQGRVQLEDGKLVGVKVNQQIASLVNLPNLEEINFREWVNMFSIADGKLLIKELKIKALGADYVINGAHGFDGSLDYSMSMLLSEEASAKIVIPGFAGEAAKLFQDNATGRIKLDFAVGGNTESPKVSLDTKPAQKRVEEMAKQKLNDESKKLEDQLKKKGEDLLKGLFKKK